MRRSIIACLLLGASCAADAAELGRLFYTPMQRAEMDRKRLLNISDTEADKPASQLTTVNGRITSSGGQSTTWVNGVPDYDRSGSAAGRSAKVGQTVDAGTGETRDSLEGGSLVIKPAR